MATNDKEKTEEMNGYRPGDICFYCGYSDVNIQGEERKVYPDDTELTKLLSPKPTVYCKIYDRMVFKNHRCNGYSDL